WQQHGAMTRIADDGTGSINYRSYTFCHDDPKPPCDEVDGNEIVSGGHILFALTDATSGERADGIVTYSNDPATPIGTEFTALVAHRYLLTMDFWGGFF